jgi:hypothetical protein
MQWPSMSLEAELAAASREGKKVREPVSDLCVEQNPQRRKTDCRREFYVATERCDNQLGDQRKTQNLMAKAKAPRCEESL